MQESPFPLCLIRALGLSANAATAAAATGRDRDSGEDAALPLLSDQLVNALFREFRHHAVRRA